MPTKEEILDKIRRTAKENDGKPLGEATFQKETGIGRYEWGKYWSKFGDAQEEAGFKRNEPWRRVSDELLVEKMIPIIRKLGKYPSVSELYTESNNDRTVPYTIIKKRGQAFIVHKIVEYCSNKIDYADILEACQPIIDKINEIENLFDSNKKDNVGEVYLIKSDKFYRIGRSIDTIRRGREISIQLPETTIMIHKIKTDDPSGVESYWHRRFKDKRMRGDWFNLNSEDVKKFKRWKKIY